MVKVRSQHTLAKFSANTSGLQCHTALFTWKLCFEVDGQLYELILSACSANEEEAWMKALRTENAASTGDSVSGQQIPSALGIDLKPTVWFLDKPALWLADYPYKGRLLWATDRASAR